MDLDLVTQQVDEDKLFLDDELEKVPEELSEEGKVIYQWITTQLVEHIHANLDRFLLVSLCELLVEQKRLLEAVRENGYTISQTNARGKKTYVTSPEAKQLNQVMSLVEKFCKTLGFAPTQRRELLKKTENC